MWKEIQGYILRDVDNENEIKMYTVVLRVDLLIMLVYYGIALCGTLLMDKWAAGGICLFGVCVCLFMFHETYKSRTRVVFALFSLSFLFLTVICTWMFGNDINVYNFFYVQLLLLYVLDYMSLKKKAVCTGLLLILRIAVFTYMQDHPPFYPAMPGEVVFWRMINMLFFTILLIVTVYISTQDFREMQEKLIAYNRKLQNIADMDPLTGLCNRRSAIDYMKEHAEKYQMGEHNGLTIAIGDIDFFKKVNDTYGHTYGDVVLKGLAELFERFMSDKGLAVRWGGEEFLFIFCDINGDEAGYMLSQLREQIHKMTFRFGEATVKVTMTFGLAEYNLRNDMETTIEEADEKLYIGKERGRDIIIS